MIPHLMKSHALGIVLLSWRALSENWGVCGLSSDNDLAKLMYSSVGKPHPRWADSNFRDGDPNEKWHSRATKCASGKRSPDSSNRTTRTAAGNHLPSPIKAEPIPETSSGLYRFSASPGLASGSMRYHQSFTGELEASNGSPTSPYEDQRNFSPSQTYGSHPSTIYHAHSTSGTSSYSIDTNGSYGNNHGYGSATPNDQYHSSPHQRVYCPCRTSPATGVAYLALSQHLQNSLSSLRQYSHHSQCQLFRKIIELNDIVQWVFPAFQNMPSILLDLLHFSNGIELNESTTSGHGTAAGQQSQPYDSNTPSDNELLTPLSASSGHAPFHTSTGSPGVASQEWNNLATAGYNPYFSLPANGDHHNVYTHVIP